MEKNLKLVKLNYNVLYKKAQQQADTTKDSEMNQVNLSKKPKKKSKRRANPNKIRSSLSKYQEKLAIMDKIFPKSDENPILNQNSLQTRTNSKEKDKGKTLKVLSFQKKDGVFVRGMLIDPDNPQEIKKKFYPLGYGDIIRLNKKKMSHFPIINISDIKEKDPYQWGREQAIFQNQGKMNIMRLYTRKLSVVSSARKEIGVNMHFQKKNNENKNITLNLAKSVEGNEESLGNSGIKGIGRCFKQKKQMKREKKNVDSMSLLSFEELKEKYT